MLLICLTDKLVDNCGSSPLFQRRFSDPCETVLVALHSFIPIGEQDLALHKYEEYIVIDSSDVNWWTVQDKTG